MKLIAYLSTIFFSQSVFGQIDDIKNYDFHSGNIILQGIALNQHDGPNISDSLGDFYVNDLLTLKWIQKNWNGLDTSEKHVYASTYRMDILVNKTTQNSFFINLPKNILQTPAANFVFNDSLFYKNATKYLPLVSNNYEFKNIEQARLNLDSIVYQDNIISYFAPWIEFDGTFEVRVLYDYIEMEEKISALRTKFNRQFDAKIFTIGYPYESNYNELIFTIKCKEEVFQSCSENKSNWIPFKPILYTKEIQE